MRNDKRFGLANRLGLLGATLTIAALAGCASGGHKAASQESAAAQGASEAKEEHAPAAPSVLDPIKALAGTWECDFEGDGKVDCTAIYRVSANGDTVTENHIDGTAVMATHYCAAGNQPRMRDANPGKHSFMFDFVDATNLKSPNDSHMHSLKMEIIDADHLTNTWTSFDKGQPAGEAIFKLTRKKS